MVHLVARQPITSDIAKPCQRNTAAHVPPTHTSCRCDSGDTVPVWVHHLRWEPNVRLRHCGMRGLAGCLYMSCRTWRTRRRGGGLHPSLRYATLPFPQRLPSGVSPGHRRAQHERRTNTQQVDELGVPYRRREYATEVVEQDVEQDPAANNDVGPPLTVGVEQDTSAPQAVPPPTTSAPHAPARQQLPKKAHTRAHAHTHTHARRERTSGSRQA